MWAGIKQNQNWFIQGKQDDFLYSQHGLIKQASKTYVHMYYKQVMLVRLPTFCPGLLHKSKFLMHLIQQYLNLFVQIKRKLCIHLENSYSSFKDKFKCLFYNIRVLPFSLFPSEDNSLCAHNIYLFIHSIHHLWSHNTNLFL